MAGTVVSIFPRLIDELQCPKPLQALFREYPIVLAGDKLAAFYLDEEVAIDAAESANAKAVDVDFYCLWGKREQRETNVSYLELVYAAFDAGIRDVVIDMPFAMQPGIDKALMIYRKKSEQQSPEAVYNALLSNGIATPMDAVVQMAGVLGMKVHALNSGYSGIATLFREAKGFASVPRFEAPQERVDYYLKHGFEADIEVLGRMLRRVPTKTEIDTVCRQATLFLNDDSGKLQKIIFDEKPTAELIMSAVSEKPVLGLFQAARLFRSSEDLDGTLRSFYGEDRVARLSMMASDENEGPKHPQYRFCYSMKECTVIMTEAYARELHKSRLGPGLHA